MPGGVPGAANWRFGNAYTDEGGTYWQITTMPPDAEVFGPVELVGSGMSGGGAHEPEIARHAVEHDPARVLREIDAKRQLLEIHGRLDVGEFCSTCDAPSGIPGRPDGCDTLRILAAPYIDRPGHREEWQP